jgi:hypothetical protein
MLDELLGALSFDPLEFIRMKPRDQYDALRKAIDLAVDIEELDRLNKSDFSKRTDINRDAKAKRAQAEAIAVPNDLGDEPPDTSAILDQMTQAAEKNGLIEQRRARRVQAQKDIDTQTATAKQLRDDAAKMIERAESVEQSIATLQEALDGAVPLPDPVDVADLRVQLDAAQAQAKLYQARDQRRAIEAQAEHLEADSKALTEAMEAREKAKADAIVAAAMPVEGLGFGDGVVLYQGVPLDQASSAEQLKVSLGIAMAANPTVRVIRIQDGSLLDDVSLAQVAEMARAGDYQIWLEKVDASGQVGIVIEDGEVAAVDGIKKTRKVAAAVA